METSGYIQSMSKKECTPYNAVCKDLFGKIKLSFSVTITFKI